MARFSAIAATLLCWGAGVYLLIHNTQVNNDFFDLLAHSIGVYFIGKGFFVDSSLWQQTNAVEELEQIRALLYERHEQEHSRESG